MARTRKDDQPDMTLPLFDEPPHVPRERRSSQRAVTQGRCPYCHKEKVGLLRSASHLVWREHTYRTYSGAPITCRASGVALCVAPSRVVDTYTPAPMCACGKGRP
jgi:hypothetical protein